MAMAKKFVQLTNQAAFDAVLRGIRAQKYVPSGGRDWDEKFYGLYRGPDGLKSSIGHLIPDGVYCPDVEEASIVEVYYGNPNHYFRPGSGRKTIQWVRRQVKGGLSLELLEKLQLAHDRRLDPQIFDNPPEEWEKRMRELAEDYGLQYTQPE